MTDPVYEKFSTLDDCLAAYASCVYRRAHGVGRSENQAISVMEENMRIEMACLRAVKSFVPAGGLPDMAFRERL